MQIQVNYIHANWVALYFRHKKIWNRTGNPLEDSEEEQSSWTRGKVYGKPTQITWDMVYLYDYDTSAGRNPH